MMMMAHKRTFTSLKVINLRNVRYAEKERQIRERGKVLDKTKRVTSEEG